MSRGGLHPRVCQPGPPARPVPRAGGACGAGEGQRLGAQRRPRRGCPRLPPIVHPLRTRQETSFHCLGPGAAARELAGRPLQLRRVRGTPRPTPLAPSGDLRLGCRPARPSCTRTSLTAGRSDGRSDGLWELAFPAGARPGVTFVFCGAFSHQNPNSASAFPRFPPKR